MPPSRGGITQILTLGLVGLNSIRRCVDLTTNLRCAPNEDNNGPAMDRIYKDSAGGRICGNAPHRPQIRPPAFCVCFV